MKKMLKIIAMLLITAAVVFAAGCAQKPETAGNETRGGSEQVPPATPETTNVTGKNVTGENITGNNTTGSNITEIKEIIETGQIVTKAESGTRISLKNGENFTLELWENPSTGASWELNLSEGLTIINDAFVADIYPGETEVPPGRGGVHLWVIEAIMPGTQHVDGIYKRSFENITIAEDNFTLIVEIE